MQVLAQCSLAAYNVSYFTVKDGNISTFDIHPGDINKDGFPDLVIEGKYGPFYILNTTTSKGAIVTFSSTQTSVFYHSNSQYNYSCNTADFNNDSLSDIVELWGDSLFFYRDTIIGSTIKFKLDAILRTSAIVKPASVGGNTNSVLIADINHDGLLDVITDNRYGTAVVFINTTSGKGAPLSFKAADTIVYSKTAPKKTSYTNMEGMAVADFNADNLPDLLVQFNDSILTFQNTSSSGTVSFKKVDGTKMPVAPSYTTGSGNFLVVPVAADIDRDGYTDLMVSYTVTNKSLDSNFVFFLHHKPTNKTITWDSIVKMYVRWKKVGSSSMVVDIGACCLASYGCSKPDLIVVFDASETGSTNTFNYYENISTPGNIKFNIKPCIINNANSDMVIGCDFNKDTLIDYVSYQDAAILSVLTDTLHVKNLWKHFINGKLTIVAGDTDSYVINSKVSGNFYWSTTGGTILSGQGTDSVRIVWTGSGGIDTVKVTNNCGDTFTVVAIKSTTSIDLLEKDNFSLFPNPNPGIFTLHYKGTDNKPFTVEVLDILGQVVYQKKIYTNSGNTINYVIDISTVSVGSYLVRITNDNRTSVRQINLVR